MKKLRLKLSGGVMKLENNIVETVEFASSAAVGQGGGAGIAFEYFDEITGVGIAQHLGNDINALVAGFQHFHSLFDFDAVYITNKILVHGFAESAGKITGTQTTDAAHFLNTGDLVQIIMDIFKRGAELLGNLFALCGSTQCCRSKHYNRDLSN